MEHVDVVVVGAGISGISAGWHLQRHCPDRSYVILEGRAAIGGTWDLFRYPGVRSDSDMHTLGFAFQPWVAERSIAGGESILRYVEETAREHGIDRRIRFGHRVQRASWSTDDARWTLKGEGPDGEFALTCGFLDLCSGYYDYERGHQPVFPGAARFRGRIVHPQFWPADLDYAGMEVVVIGSGATAMTLVLAMTGPAAHVTMLQRSPTYVVSLPARDRVAAWLRGLLPNRAAYRLTRWKNVTLQMIFFRLARKRPDQTKKRLLGLVQQALGPDYDVATHFTPSYNPWDQRLCLVPDADLFETIKSGRASVVTDTIETFTEEGIRLASGKTLPADVIVTATGLELKMAGGIALSLDGEPLNLAERLHYKGLMYDGVPNLATTFGYTNASWTLKADLTALYLCRLLNTMRKRGLRQATPRNDDPAMAEAPFLEFTSGYIGRAAALLPKQGAKKPWKLNQNYALDVLALKYGSVDDALVFSNPKRVAQPA